jgi:hypothetical protein
MVMESNGGECRIKSAYCAMALSAFSGTCTTREPVSLYF